MKNKIFKICPFDIWEEAKLVGLFSGYGIDITDGFIHFSTIHQIENTLKHLLETVKDSSLNHNPPCFFKILWVTDI